MYINKSVSTYFGILVTLADGKDQYNVTIETRVEQMLRQAVLAYLLAGLALDHRLDGFNDLS